MGCLAILEDDLELGSINLITLGLTSVDTIRKNNIKKNIISFNDSVATSASSFFRILYLDMVFFLEMIKNKRRLSF
jgi:hypothetical protein